MYNVLTKVLKCQLSAAWNVFIKQFIWHLFCIFINGKLSIWSRNWDYQNHRKYARNKDNMTRNENHL